jgi:hypothetical protein
VGAGNCLRGTVERQLEELIQNLLYSDEKIRGISYASVLPLLDR